MSLPPITVIPAGAGSGKTHSIQEKLGEWVMNGEVAPERIVAVTFTEAAASELSERIRGKLLAQGRLDEALRLDQAYISTIHGFGVRLLTEFAFDAGLSPKPRLLNEDEENTLIRLALSRTDKVDPVLSQLHRFGYRYSFNVQLSAEEMFREDLLQIVHRLRHAGWSEKRASFLPQALKFITDRYGEVEDGDALTEQLHVRIKALLAEFPESLALHCEGNQTAYKALIKDFKNLKRGKDRSILEQDFELWQALRNLRQSKGKCKLPPRYDALTSAVMAAANHLPSHPGPLELAQVHIRALIEGGQEVLEHYAELKCHAGLVDYTDMIAMADEMLRTQPNVMSELINRIDCLVVDEFQDTNPLQFSLLWQLQSAGIPTVIVGDLKQAIMGFQGADPRLFEQIEKQHQDIVEPLVRNWRSQPAIMDFVNALGPGLFGKAYTKLIPQSKETDVIPLEAIEFPIRAKKNQHMVRAYSLGKRIKALLQEEALEVIDPRTKEVQPLRGEHIAVLCYTRDMLSQYSTVFRALGLRVRMQEEEWFSSRIVQILWHALAFVANPKDRHAALYLSVTELGNLSLQESLTQLMDEGEISDPILEALQEISISVMDRTVYALVDHVLEKLKIFTVISSWPDADQARANVLKLQAEVGEFMDANREAMASGGFYGSGLQSFIGWLEQKVQLKDRNTQPDPSVVDEEAIELVTWHSSKGREWPIVAVCGLDREVKARLPQMNLGYQNFGQLDRLLDNANIEYAPKFAAPESNDRFLRSLQEEQETEALRLIYVAITRAREKLILEWPSYLSDNKVTYWSLLNQKTDLSLREDHWQSGEKKFSCMVTTGESELPEGFGLEHNPVSTVLPAVGRRAVEKSTYAGETTQDSIAPSALKPVKLQRASLQIQTIKYGSKFNLDIGLTATDMGTFLHKCFEVLAVNAKSIGRLEALTEVELGDDQKNVIANQVVAFEKLLKEHFLPQTIMREVPILALGRSDSVVSGTVDMLVSTEEGVWIIDHKSDQVTEAEKAFELYKPQLDAYADVVRKSGIMVLGVGINWIASGEIMLENQSEEIQYDEVI